MIITLSWQCFVIAAAQVGTHIDNPLRQSWGKAMIVDPWGTVIARVPSDDHTSSPSSTKDDPSFALADVNLDCLQELRRSMPVLEHRRNDIYPELKWVAPYIQVFLVRSHQLSRTFVGLLLSSGVSWSPSSWEVGVCFSSSLPFLSLVFLFWFLWSFSCRFNHNETKLMSHDKIAIVSYGLEIPLISVRRGSRPPHWRGTHDEGADGQRNHVFQEN